MNIYKKRRIILKEEDKHYRFVYLRLNLTEIQFNLRVKIAQITVKFRFNFIGLHTYLTVNLQLKLSGSLTESEQTGTK